VAIVRARGVGAVVLLGTATPSLESYANVEAGKYALLELPERVDDASLPAIMVVDMTEERKRKFELFRQSRKEEFIAGREAAKANKRSFDFGPISDLLAEHITDRLERKEGIILLQNRRGFAPFVECPDCGYVAMCDRCNISLTYHMAQEHLRCHYCGNVKPPPELCPDCRSSDIRYRGFGTQRVEEELQRLYPEARILRMDLDTTTGRGSHDRILRKFSEGEADILLGTQMVAKGLDFSRVTLVGVISADTQMLLPDFRSAERTFQLLTQVAGRAGRSALAGEVVIQTCQPGHYALRHVLMHDFKAFYREEIQVRRELHYPPFSRLVLVEFRAAVEEEAIREANAFARRMKTDPHWIMLGPASAAIQKIKGNYRWHILLKSLKETDPSGQRLHEALRRAVQPGKGGRGSVKVVVDVDPAGMM
jgi:primosomal protein N' (replication factor Y)